MLVLLATAPSSGTRAATVAAEQATDLSGRWQARRAPPLVRAATGTSGALQTTEGRLPPYTVAAQSRFWHRVDMEQRGTPVANTQDTCRPRLPQAMLSLFLGPFDVVQTATALYLLFEADGDHAWQIRLDRDHPRKLRPSYFGDSVGRWEKGELVVDGVGFNGRPWLDGQGSPLGPRAHIVTRMNRSGDTLKFTITIVDPENYSHAWSYEYVADRRPDLNFYEVHCLENVRPESNENIVYEDIKPIPGIFDARGNH